MEVTQIIGLTLLGVAAFIFLYGDYLREWWYKGNTPKQQSIQLNKQYKCTREEYEDLFFKRIEKMTDDQILNNLYNVVDSESMLTHIRSRLNALETELLYRLDLLKNDPEPAARTRVRAIELYFNDYAS